MNVVILAAGQGKRMRSSLPKVLHPIGGVPMLAHVIEQARALEPSRICVVYGHGGEAVPQAFADQGLAFARQAPQLGTAHAVQQAMPHVDRAQPVLVLYGDVPLTRASTLERMRLDDAQRQVKLLTVEVADPTGYGRILRNTKGAVAGVVEERDATDKQRAIREVNTGILCVPGMLLGQWLADVDNDNAQGEYYLPDIIRLACVDRVPVVTERPDEIWETLGVNGKAQLAQLERVYQFEVARGLLDAGVTLADPSRIDVRGTLLCGVDVTIDVGCVFEGTVKLADGVSVGPHCVIRDATIGVGTRIEAFTHIDTATVGERARIGPYARLRPDAALADEVHIGNFVEVKASTFGARSKANHLAYVGDAVVGRDVNIGAGTITCNYDGANKHRTVIEDDVHIGSDVQLVAPVKIGKRATVGAGTTVWQDVPAGGLTINDKTQPHRADWQRPQKARPAAKKPR
ncbi:MAG: bifunctional UDP-N-acetylglucosamine diphosphorylase/glucosamine-1-phosphate N-acetyltransferase GlmU [Proteobacteria bacterium]|nr:bifunctional UDP-N-acetylglucosamine diphosphorylase/glucosamine-1-phosphate N-acetyltransferase GlmU [Burkholderiales bacterium]